MIGVPHHLQPTQTPPGAVRAVTGCEPYQLESRQFYQLSMKTHLVRICLTLPMLPSVLFAGDFLNLDFENPDLTHLLSGRTFTSEALQGWKFATDASVDFLKYTYVGVTGLEPLDLATFHRPFSSDDE